MVKYLLSDLDGTLLYPDINVDTYTKEAIHAAHEIGLRFIIATGRLDQEIKAVEKLIDTRVEYRISQNGVFIYNHDNELLFSNHFQEDVLKPLITDALNIKDIEVFFATQERYFPVRKDDKVTSSDHMRSVFVEPKRITELLSTKTYDLTKIVLIHDDFDILKKYYQFFKKKYYFNIDIVQTARNSIEIMPKSSCKGNAALWLCGYLKIQPQEIATIGDSYNDESMLKITPFSFAMANADEKIRNTARFTVKSVGEAIHYLINQNLIEEK